MENEYGYPTQTFRFHITFEYEVDAYNVKQAYEMIDHLDITTRSRSSRSFPIGRRSPKQMRYILKRLTRREFEERPEYYSNATASCSTEARLIPNRNNWRKPHQFVKYLGKVAS